MHAFRSVLNYDLLEDRRIDNVTSNNNLLHIKQIYFMLPSFCTVRHRRRCQIVVRTSVTHSTAPRVVLLCSYHILTSSAIYYVCAHSHARTYTSDRSCTLNSKETMSF